MKFLFVFIDMLRPNLLNICNPKENRTSLDRLINQIGGTLYTNCYTPAPDTPRSHGCLLTSRYPKDNGINNRLYYPKYFMKPDCPDFLTILKEMGYEINIYHRPRLRNDIGQFPSSVDSCVNPNDYSFKQYVDNLKIQDNSVTYFVLDDFHRVLTAYHNQRKSLKIAFQKITNEIEYIRERIDIDTFDLSIFFSDHGLKLRDQEYWNDGFKALDKDRTQIFMLLRQQGDRIVVKNNKLSSIMDIFPTVLHYAGISYDSICIEGKDLFDIEDSEYIIIEDHEGFSVTIGLPISHWMVRTKNGAAYTDYKLNWQADYILSDNDKDKFEKLLIEKASEFKESIEMSRILRIYERVNRSYDYYDDGTRVIEHTPIGDCLKQVVKWIIKR